MRRKPQNNRYRVELTSGQTISIKAAHINEARNRVYLLGDTAKTVQREYRSGKLSKKHVV